MDQASDAFMYLLRRGKSVQGEDEKQYGQGETLDAKYRGKGAFAILGFTVASQKTVERKDPVEEAARKDRKEERKRQAQEEKLEQQFARLRKEVSRVKEGLDAVRDELKRTGGELKKLRAERAKQGAEQAKRKLMEQGRMLDSFRFSISKYIDSISPLLYQSYCQTLAGEMIPYDKAKIVVRKGGAVVTDEETGRIVDFNSEEFLTLIFEEVFVTSYRLDLSGTYPSESVGFSFVRCFIQYRPQDASGNLGSKIMRGWDFGTRTGFTPAQV